jgi:tRNA (guanine-N7-)-methyltransferase
VKGRDRESTCGVPFPGTTLPRPRWTRTRVPLGARGAPFSFEQAFGRTAPRVLDLGCGNGRFLIASALARPQLDHLGIDLVPPAVKFASLRAGQRGLLNCKVAWGDATEFVLERCPDASVAEVHLYHPQPYREPGHRARRQLTPEVLAAVHRVLEPGGLFVVQTDNRAYAAYARRVVPALFAVEEHPAPWPDAPRGRTLREIVARSQGLEVTRLLGRRLDLSRDDAGRRAAALPPPDFDAGPPPVNPSGSAARPRRPSRARNGGSGSGRGTRPAGGTPS